jgi:hypothetical protein
MRTSEAEDQKRSAIVAAALDDLHHLLTDVQSRADVAQLLAHLYKNGYRTAEQLKAALSPAVLQARFG